MGKRSGKRYRVPCTACEAKLDVPPEAGRLIGYVIPGGDKVEIVCNQACEQKLYQGARIINWLISGDPVAMHSDSIIRHDLALKHGSVGIRDGKIVYLDVTD